MGGELSYDLLRAPNLNMGMLREGWVGLIRSERQALKEAATWEAAEDSFGNHWSADVFHSCADVKRRVREWQKEVKERRGL